MKIGLIGTFDVDNYGDCLFPDIIAKELKKRIENTEITLFSPTKRVSKLGNYEKINQLPGELEKYKSLNCNALVLAGGEIINNGNSLAGLYCSLPLNSMTPGMRMWMGPAIMKATKGTTYIINAVGVGHIDNKIKDGLSTALKLADYKTVRDENSADFLNKINCPTPVAIDCAFLVSTLFENKQWEDIAKRVLPKGLNIGSYLVVQCSSHYIKNKLTDWCKAILQVAKITNLPILLLPICYHHADRVTLEKVYYKLKDFGSNSILIKQYLKTSETAAIIGCSGGYCGTSLHGAVTAISFKKATSLYCKSSKGKHSGVLKTVNSSHSHANSLDSIPSTFVNSLKSDKDKIISEAIKSINAEFDEIGKIIKKGANKKVISNDDWEKMREAIKIDSSYYANINLKSRFKRNIFRILRSNYKTNELYELLSAKIRKHYQ